MLVRVWVRGWEIGSHKDKGTSVCAYACVGAVIHLCECCVCMCMCYETYM